MMHACFSAVGFGNSIWKKMSTVKLALESELRRLTASVGHSFLVNRFDGLPRFEEKARARKCALAMSFIQ